MRSDALEDCVRYKEELHLITVLDHLNQYIKHIEDVDICERFFGIEWDKMCVDDTTGAFIMNTAPGGVHWIPAILCRATEPSDGPQRFTFYTCDSMGYNHDPALCIKLCLKYFNTFTKCIGFLVDEPFKTYVLNPFHHMRKKIGEIDPRLDDFWQLIGDDMNQIINDPVNWRRMVMESNINISSDDIDDLRSKIGMISGGNTIPFNLYAEKYHALDHAFQEVIKEKCLHMIQTRQMFDSSRFASTLESNTHMAEDKRALIADCVKEMHDLVMNLPYLYDSQLAESFQMIERIDKINRKTKRVVRALRKYAFARGWSIL
eukprot:910740_1